MDLQVKTAYQRRLKWFEALSVAVLGVALVVWLLSLFGKVSHALAGPAVVVMILSAVANRAGDFLMSRSNGLSVKDSLLHAFINLVSDLLMLS